MANAASSGSGRIVKCPFCGAANRVSPQAVSGGSKRAVCGRCKRELSTRPDSAGGPVTVTDADFDDIVASVSMPVLVDLWAAWCGPCRLLAPTIDALARELGGKALVAKLDVDANPRTSARFGIQGIPTLLILKDGREVDRIVGVQSGAAIFERLRPFL